MRIFIFIQCMRLLGFYGGSTPSRPAGHSMEMEVEAIRKQPRATSGSSSSNLAGDRLSSLRATLATQGD
jgi:hypothetical protein